MAVGLVSMALVHVKGYLTLEIEEDFEIYLTSNRHHHLSALFEAWAEIVYGTVIPIWLRRTLQYYIDTMTQSDGLQILTGFRQDNLLIIT